MGCCRTPHSHLALEKNNFPASVTVLCSPTSVFETKGPARGSKSQVSVKVKTAHFQLWAAASLRREQLINCSHRKRAFIPAKEKDRHPAEDVATDCGFSSGWYLCHLSSVLLGCAEMPADLREGPRASHPSAGPPGSGSPNRLLLRLPSRKLPRFASVKPFSSLSSSFPPQD